MRRLFETKKSRFRSDLAAIALSFGPQEDGDADPDQDRRAMFEKKANWQPYSITDGHLVTGQNPASSTQTAQALMKLVSTLVPA
jgi:putative intracellular protease/amidase